MSAFLSRVLAVFLAFGLIASPAQADLAWKLYEFNNLDGGLNDSTNAISLGLDEASNLQNIIFPRTINGAIAKRPGFTRINSTALSGTPDCTGLKFFKNAAGTRWLISVWEDDKIRKMEYGAGSGPDGTWDDITGTIVFVGTADDQADFAIAQDSVIIEDGIGTTAPYRWTGAGDAAALGGGSPSAKFVEYHRRHLFAAGDTSQPSRLYFSNLGDILTWTITDFINVEDNAGDGIIRGLATGLDGLYIWKDSAIWRLTGTNRDDFILERMVQGIGTLANSSIATINSIKDSEQLFVFMTQNGDIAVYDGGVTVQIISTKILNSVPKSLEFSRNDEVVATAYEFTYAISVTVSGESAHSRIYLCDFLHGGAWTMLSGMVANAIASCENGSGKENLMFGDYSGFTNLWDIDDTSNLNDPSTTAISAFYETGHLTFSDSGVEKNVRVMRIFVNQQGSSNTLDIEVREDFESAGETFSISLAGSGAVWDTAVYDVDRWADLAVLISRIEPNAGLNTFLFRFSNDRVSETFRIRKFQVLVEPTGRV